MRIIRTVQQLVPEGSTGKATRFLKPPAHAPLFLGGLFVLAFCLISSAQPTGVHISEFMASNVSIHPDNADLDDYSDWIELHNPTPDPVDLGFHFLTDDLTAPTKWTIPENTVLPGNGFLTIRADDGNAVPGDVRFREFSPWDDFTNIFHHTNFKLSSGGESLALFRFEGTVENIELIPTGATWRFFDKGTDPGADWAANTFDDSSWDSGEAQLGYGEDDEQTVIDYGGDRNNKYPAYFFRSSFNIVDLAEMRQLELRLLADDGAIVHLNGTEIFRINMPSGLVDHTTHANALGEEDVFISTNVPVALLLAGKNTVAVQVHQRNDSSSDVSFDFELSAVRLNGTPVLVDSVTFGQQYPNVSYARNPNDDGNWYFYGEPTPNAPNTTIAILTPTPSTPVEFSIANGFYDEAKNVVLSTESGAATIHYTLDGSVPGSDSPSYTDPILISSTTVIRARTFEPGKIPGPLATQTVFVTEPERDLPVISFVVDPEEFFDETIGIYTNVYKGREAAIHLEYFDENAELGFAVNAGTKIAGENIWRFAQKPMTINMRGKYGDDVIRYQIFDEDRFGLFGRFILRNGGDNWPNAMLRDAMTPHLLRGQSDADVQNYRPVVVYMNGEYWGIHNLREKLDDQYFFNKHHINAGTYDYLEYAHIAKNTTGLAVAEGEADTYNAFLDAARTNDLSVAQNYLDFAEQMDMESFIDFVAAEDFVYNSSWPWNREFWREQRPDAKWRWVVPDLDRGFNMDNISKSLIDNLDSSYTLFRELAESDLFKEHLAQRYSAHLSSTFLPQRISDILDRLDAEVLAEMPRHINKWKSDDGIQSLSERQDELDEIKQFATQRAAHVRTGIANHLGISNTAELTINVVPEGAGTVRLHGVPMLPEYSATATMYRDIPLDIAVEPTPGFEFEGWSDGLGSDSLIAIALTGDQTLTATFVVSPETVLPPVIDSDLTLTLAGSPYTSDGTVTVNPNVTLTVEAGVEIKLPELADLNILGALVVNGSESEPVFIGARSSSKPWGVIAFLNATDTSTISHAIIRDSSIGAEPVNLISAISNMGSDVVLSHVDIEAPATIFARGGSTTLLSSRIYSPFTGDGINVKQGDGRVEDTTFIGNTAPDTDAIDFDGVTNGVIARNRVLAFRGYNSDGIDVGEGCVNLLVSSNLIYNSSDKGISVGQGSEVFVERNLIVGCALGIGIKDTGSIAYVDQNTFANNDVGVAIFEKNLSAGGGEAVVSNSIFSRSKKDPVTTDAKSTATITYSLSDTLPLTGTGNFVDDPLFTDAAIYDFTLQPDSPAIDAGDPAHAPDPDASRADIGAYYAFDPEHYPYITPNVIVINEVMAHSHDELPDWIELYNTSEQPVDISGWFLSDNKSNLTKYRIAADTIIPGNGYLVFYEDQHFGALSTDPGVISPFALSENGETAYLFSPGDGLFLDYNEKEAFGASATGIPIGRHFKDSSNTYNFVFMTEATPGAANSAPLVGPISISEIMYHPEPNGDAEFIELVNIASTNVTLYGEFQGEPWQIVDGFDFVFPDNPKVTMIPGERIVLVRNLTAFNATYTAPPGTQVFQWTSGSLNNDGEKLEIAMPGDIDESLERQYIRVDRVNFNDADLWPIEADGLGKSLTRLNDTTYGNDVANWIAADPTPGAAYVPPLVGFAKWADEHSLPANLSGPLDDSDGDGIVNLLEYVLDLSPSTIEEPPQPEMTRQGDTYEITLTVAADLEGVVIELLGCSSLDTPDWQPVPEIAIEPIGQANQLRATVTALDPEMYFQLRVELTPTE